MSSSSSSSSSGGRDLARVLALHEMIYLPPNGVNVHYAKTTRMEEMWPQGLAHPRAYVTYEDYRLLLFTLVFCEWTDERNVTRYYGFTEHDAHEIVEKGNTEDVMNKDPALIVPLSQMREQTGGFYDRLSDARRRCLDARRSHDNRKNRGDAMAPFLAFFASVARHDDPVATEKLLPIECIARAALVAHEHDEEKRRKAMELLAKQSGEINRRDLTTIIMELVCDVFVLLLVFGNEAYDFIVYFVARVFGTGLGWVLSGVFGSNWIACWAYVIIDIAIVLVTMLNPFLIASFPVAIGAVVASSAVGEAKAKCAGSAATRAVQWLTGALGNQVVRIVTNVLRDVDLEKDVKTIVEAARQTVSNVVGDVMVGMAFQLIDEKITGYFAKMHNKLVACFIRVCIHGTIAKMIEQTSASYSKSYLRMLVPKWMNIASIGVGNSKAEKQAELMKKAKDAEGKQAQLREAERALEEAEGNIENFKMQLESAKLAVESKQKRVTQIELEISNATNSTKIPDNLQSDLDTAMRELNDAKATLKTLNGTFQATNDAKEEARKKVTKLLKETQEAQDAKQYEKLRKEATEKAEKAATDVNEKKNELETAKDNLEIELAKNKEKQDQNKIEDLTQKVAKAERSLAEARRKLYEADVGNHFVEAARRREQGLGSARNKRENAKNIRNNRNPIRVVFKEPIAGYNPKPSPIKVKIPIQNPVERPSPSPGPGTGAARSSGPSPSLVPDPSSTQTPQPETQLEQAARQAAKLENEAAEIEREYDVNPSWSSQIFEWLSKQWNSNAEQNPQKPGGADQNSQNPETEQKTKTKMGSYV